MRAFVFTDKALAKHAGQFVWLSIDTEKSSNADFLKKYPVRVWPSMYIIDPAKEAIAIRWAGGATAGQLDKLFAQGERAVRGGRKGGEEALARADALYAKGDYEASIPAYREALKGIPVVSPEYARAIEALIYCLYTTRQGEPCVELARTTLPKLRLSPTSATLAGYGLDCALRAPKDAPGRAEAIQALEAEARTIVANKRLPISADDRSALYGTIYDARDDAGDEAGAKAVAATWVAYLDAEAAAAKTPEQRTALDPNRLNADEAAGEIAKAIPMLEQSEKDFPQDYNPPARLALVYQKLGRWDEALAASDRALERVYGPRRIRVLLVRADIYKGKGDAAAEKRTVEEALKFAEDLPAGQRSEDTIASLKKRLSAVS
jgi:tetratricopeptide (TPR) repeat protein